MIEAIRSALAAVFSVAFRKILLRSLAVTAIVLLAAWLLVSWLFRAIVMPFLTAQGAFASMPWLADVIGWLAVLIFAAAVLALAIPITVAVSRLFLRDVVANARASLAAANAATPRAAPAPTGPPDVVGSMRDGLRFLTRAVPLYIVLSPLALIPVVNGLVFAAANAYLLGRHHFLVASTETRGEAASLALYRANRARVFVGGLVLFVVSAVPLLNLLAPTFGPTFMLRLSDDLAARARTP